MPREFVNEGRQDLFTGNNGLECVRGGRVYGLGPPRFESAKNFKMRAVRIWGIRLETFSLLQNSPKALDDFTG